MSPLMFRLFSLAAIAMAAVNIAKARADVMPVEPASITAPAATFSTKTGL